MSKLIKGEVMRDIRFRAWDKVINKMKSNQYLEKYPMIILQSNGELEFMQYVGLLDKEGIEIFEGDIVEYETDKLRYRIEFLNGEFICRRKYENIVNLDFCSCDYGKELKVIGNIYENKELL